MAFVKFQAIAWPEQATRLLTVPASDVVAFRDRLAAQKAAPKTINRRISGQVACENSAPATGEPAGILAVLCSNR